MSQELDEIRDTLREIRAGVARALAAVPEADFRRVVVPSGWCLLGQLQHLTMNDRYWLRWGLAGETIAGVTVTDGVCHVVLEDYENDDEWRVPETITPAIALERYRREGVAADHALEGVDVDGRVRQADPAWAPWFGLERADDLDARSVLHHVTRHASEHYGQLAVGIELLAGR